MPRYHHLCPDCGLDVVTNHPTVQLLETKVCACPSEPVETVEDTEQ
jgi:hypothetical protein